MLLGHHTLGEESLATVVGGTTQPATFSPDVLFDTRPYGSRLKHRREAFDVSVSLSDLLSTGETIQSLTALEISRRLSTTDVAAEFGSPTGAIVGGTDVHFRLGPASGTDQSRAFYQIRIEVTTTEGDTYIARNHDGTLPILRVIDT